MRQSATRPCWCLWVAIVLAILGVIGYLGVLGTLVVYAFWILLVGFVVLVAASMMKAS